MPSCLVVVSVVPGSARDLFAALEGLPDPRSTGWRRHRLGFVLAVVFSAFAMPRASGNCCLTASTVPSPDALSTTMVSPDKPPIAPGTVRRQSRSRSRTFQVTMMTVKSSKLHFELLEDQCGVVAAEAKGV